MRQNRGQKNVLIRGGHFAAYSGLEIDIIKRDQRSNSLLVELLDELELDGPPFDCE